MLRIVIVLALLAACASAQAQTPAASCAAAVKKVQASPEMRTGGPASDHRTTDRANAAVYLQQAAAAAARGDEKTCQKYLDLATTALTF